MSEALWLATAALLTLAGMGWLALAMEVHWGQVMHRPAESAARTRRLLRTLGIAALPLSLLACLMADRPSMAVLVWVMLLAGSAVAVAMTLARCPQVLRALWPVDSAAHPQIHSAAPTRSTLLAPSLLAVSLAHAGLVWWAVTSLRKPPEAVTLPVMIGQLVSQAPVTESEPLPMQPEPPKPQPTTPKPRPAPVPPAPKAPPSERAVTAPPAEPPAPPLSEPAVAEPSPAPAPPPAAASPVAAEPAAPVILPRSDAAHLSNPAPVYPAVSRRLREQGRVLFDVYILPDGTVGEIKLKRSSGFARLDAAALEAVRQWRYVPAKRGDQPIPFWYVQPIDFAMR
jgi:protein TonB